MIDYENTVLEFLSKEENLPIALEVAKLVERLRIKLHTEFWFEFRDALQDRLAQSDWANEWKIQMTDRDRLFKDWAKCSLVPRTISQGQRFLRASLQHGTRASVYHLQYGLSWNESVSSDLGIDEVTKLVDELKSEGFGRDRWWCGLRNLDYSLGSDEFLLRMAADRVGVIEELAQMLWILFKSKYEQIVAINRALASAQEPD